MKSVVTLPLLALLALPAAHAATAIDETRPIDPDALIEIENVAGSVRVRAGSDDQVRVTGSLGEGVEELTIEGDRKRLRIEVEYASSGGFGWFGSRRVGDSTLEIEVPAGVQLGVETVSASIDVDGVNGPRIELESVSGSIELRSAAPVVALSSVSGSIGAELAGTRDASLETVSGAIELTGTVTGRIDAEAVSGAIVLQTEGPLSALQASGVSGNIDIRAALASGARLTAETLSGSLAVTLPPSTSATVKATSFSGAITSDAGQVEREEFGPGSSLTTRLGNGDGTVELESFSGRVKLNIK